MGTHSGRSRACAFLPACFCFLLAQISALVTGEANHSPPSVQRCCTVFQQAELICLGEFRPNHFLKQDISCCGNVGKYATRVTTACGVGQDKIVPTCERIASL